MRFRYQGLKNGPARTKICQSGLLSTSEEGCKCSGPTLLAIRRVVREWTLFLITGAKSRHELVMWIQRRRSGPGQLKSTLAVVKDREPSNQPSMSTKTFFGFYCSTN